MNSATNQRRRHLHRLLIISAICAAAVALPASASAADGSLNDQYFNHPCKVDATPETQSVDKAGAAMLNVTLTDVGPIDNGDGTYWECVKPISPLVIQLIKYDAVTKTPVLDSNGNQIVRATGTFDENGHATITINGLNDCLDEYLKVRAHPPARLCHTHTGHCWPASGIIAYDFVHVVWTGCTPPENPPVTPLVTQQGSPSGVLALSKKCTRNYMLIRPSARNGTVKSARIYVDGKLVKTLSASPFSYKLPLSRVGPGKHKVKVVFTFTDGSTKTVNRTFRDCARLSAKGHRAPAFTG